LRTDVVQYVHPSVLLDHQDQPLPLFHVERSYIFDLESWHVILLPQTSVGSYKIATAGASAQAGANSLNFPRVLISRGLSLDHRPPSVKVEKPWGYFEQYTHNLPCTVKIITVSPGGTLSRQYHEKRDELWVVLDSGARLELDGKILHPEPEEKLFIPRETVHRLSAAGEGVVRILEISFGEFDEDDIVRLEDVYGRVGP
jgi:mannose-6-phosphate isomerase